jgi:hypothetical protein
LIREPLEDQNAIHASALCPLVAEVARDMRAHVYRGILAASFSSPTEAQTLRELFGACAGRCWSVTFNARIMGETTGLALGTLER